jgi:cysteine desulfurase/selenocysteine lyase
MSTPPRVYLDNAATSWPKPEGVYRAVDAYLRERGANMGRGSYRTALATDDEVAAARKRAAGLLGVRPSQLVFTAGCTDSLNLALHGFVRPGDHVVTTAIEHNSILRPLRALEEAGVQVSRVPCDGQGFVNPDDVRNALRGETRLVAVSHASNVTGAVQPLAEIARAVRGASGARLLVDAAQSLGHVPWDAGLEIDFVAASGHKGLLGPLGVGILAIRAGLEKELRPQRQGGTGSRSDQDLQPADMPDKFESGSPNVPGIVGLSAGLEFLAKEGIEALEGRTRELTARLLAGLAGILQVTVYGPRDTESAAAGRRVGVVSFNVGEYDPRELAAILDSHYGIEIRSGIHCAQRMHQALGTLERGGAARVSLGPFNTADHVDLVVRAIAEVAASV